ncbi:MAG: hypothetical protein ABJH68_15465 [Ilumatobacter sp.]|uniref:hypothetical protein n=1 Tax=Ilumatobacter sp. TaxID=1967498 RepID=UPI00329A391D
MKQIRVVPLSDERIRWYYEGGDETLAALDEAFARLGYVFIGSNRHSANGVDGLFSRFVRRSPLSGAEILIDGFVAEEAGERFVEFVGFDNRPGSSRPLQPAKSLAALATEMQPEYQFEECQPMSAASEVVKDTAAAVRDKPAEATPVDSSIEAPALASVSGPQTSAVPSRSGLMSRVARVVVWAQRRPAIALSSMAAACLISAGIVIVLTEDPYNESPDRNSAVDVSVTTTTRSCGGDRVTNLAGVTPSSWGEWCDGYIDTRLDYNERSRTEQIAFCEGVRVITVDYLIRNNPTSATNFLIGSFDFGLSVC